MFERERVAGGGLQQRGGLPQRRRVPGQPVPGDLACAGVGARVGAGDQPSGAGGQLLQPGGEGVGFVAALGQARGFGVAAAGVGRDGGLAQQRLQLAGDLDDDDDVGGPEPGRVGRFGGQGWVGAQRGREVPIRRGGLGQAPARPDQYVPVPGGGLLARGRGGAQLRRDVRPLGAGGVQRERAGRG